MTIGTWLGGHELGIMRLLRYWLDNIMRNCVPMVYSIFSLVLMSGDEQMHICNYTHCGQCCSHQKSEPSILYRWKSSYHNNPSSTYQKPDTSSIGPVSIKSLTPKQPFMYQSKSSYPNNQSCIKSLSHQTTNHPPIKILTPQTSVLYLSKSWHPTTNNPPIQNHDTQTSVLYLSKYWHPITNHVPIKILTPRPCVNPKPHTLVM